MMASQMGKSECMLLEIGRKATADMGAAKQECKALLAEQDAAEPVALMQQALGLNEADWALTALYFAQLIDNGTVPSAEDYRAACQKLGRPAAQDLPPTMLWGRSGPQLSPICRDFLLMRQPELPGGAQLEFCTEQRIFHNREIVTQTVEFLNRYANSDKQAPAAVLLVGQKGSGRRFLLKQIAAKMQGALLLVKPQGLTEEDLNQLALASALYSAFPCVEGYTVQDEWIFEMLGPKAPVVFLTAEQPLAVQNRVLLQREVQEITAAQRSEILQSIFPDVMLSQRQWQRMAENYHLQPGELWQAAARFKAESLCTKENKLAILQGLLRQADTPEFSGGAELLSTNKTLDDLVLPAAQRKVLNTICSFAKGSSQIYKEWGFADKIPYGRGVSALFYGASGTGKTLAATALANELGLSLYRVDLSQLTSKYIGETQKNIGRIFDQAKKTGCILFFDEADALFSRRAEVSDAQDKYSNGEIAYLLQKTEQYEGVTILATNLLQNFDDAFRRRITFMVRFPMPDTALREQLWRSIFPAKAPLDEIDYQLLAEQFELSGAGIKNCAVYAAFLAAEQNKPIGMSQIVAAVKNEYDKIGKTINPRLIELFSEEGAQS